MKIPAIQKKNFVAAISVAVVIIGFIVYLYLSPSTKDQATSSTKSSGNKSSGYDYPQLAQQGDKLVVGNSSKPAAPPHYPAPPPGKSNYKAVQVKGLITEPQPKQYKLVNPASKDQSLALDFSKYKKDPKEHVNTGAVTVNGKLSTVKAGDSYTVLLSVESIQK